jgi:hypothetical protein
MRKNILVSGASVSAGQGLKDGKADSSLWINQLINSCLPNSTVTNISVRGYDNKEIFIDTAIELLATQYTHTFVCWQSIPRSNIKLGLETYRTSIGLISPVAVNDIDLVAGQKVLGKHFDSARKNILKHYNYHWDLVDLVSYTNILINLARMAQSNIYFINYSLPWSDRYFDKINWEIPSELDLFTQEILSVDLRNDAEIRQLYDMIHDHYTTHGSIKEHNWLNLYDPLHNHQIDKVSDSDHHPGVLSQNIFFDLLKPVLQKKL